MVTCSDGTIYTGYTKDLLKRLEQHNSGNRGARYTKTRRPVKLSFVEIVQTQREAILRELEIKKLPRRMKIKLINGFAG
ncbi:MAG: GIY-YIG nuclease family protein [Candidatus Heimdallarchaeota archaeon]|nr:GIY-YIG nuclease family protein [Candidatus Heimdallarchaeota archaeon]MBY8994705.1 GIY-YIG nuclease family protein [Candidatus Heimdallarchaeota archaeon]